MGKDAAISDDPFLDAVRLRRVNLPLRFCVAAIGALVFSPVINIEFALAWASAYFLLQFLDAWIFAPINAPGGSGVLTPWRKTAGAFSTVASSAIYGLFTVPMWLSAGLAGGVCASLILMGGVLNILTVSGRSRLMLGLLLGPIALYLALTPLMILQAGGGKPEAVASAVIGVALLAFTLAAFTQKSRLAESERRAQQALEKRHRECEAAAASRSTFVAAISHDLRTPLTAILTGAETLERQADDPSSRDTALLIAEAGHMMKALLDQILDHAKLEAGRMQVEARPFNLRQLLARTIRLWQREAAGKGLRLRIEGAASAPAWIEGDPVRLQQILNNLISNALKFTADGAVTLRVRAWAQDPRASAIQIEVIDTGPGMDNAQLSRLFTPFDQGDETVYARHGGTGLGLTISRDLALLMGGRLVARSTPGQGSIFTLSLTLPLASAPDDALPEAPEARTRLGAAMPLSARSGVPTPSKPVPAVTQPALQAESEPVIVSTPEPPAEGVVTDEAPEDVAEEAPERALRVLVVDDHEINRRAVQLILTPLGAEIATAEDGVAALASAARQSYDVIFMDIRMPELDGRETTRRLRAGDGPNRATPVIAVTADTAQDDIDACLAAGMDYFVSKPLTPATLLGALSHVLQNAAQENSGRESSDREPTASHAA